MLPQNFMPSDVHVLFVILAVVVNNLMLVSFTATSLFALLFCQVGLCWAYYS